MEEKRPRLLTRLRSPRGSALIVVLLAIVVLLPSTLVLTSFVLRRQQRSMDYRDLTASEFAARAGLERALVLIADPRWSLSPGDTRPVSLEGWREQARPVVRIERRDDVVLSQDGTVSSAEHVKDSELNVAGVDADGRRVFRYRKVQIYLVRIEVRRRPTLPAVRLYGVLAKLPDGGVQTLGMSMKRVFADTVERER